MQKLILRAAFGTLAAFALAVPALAEGNETAPVAAAAEAATFTLYGKAFPAGTETIDLNETAVDDLAPLTAYLKEHPEVTRVELCNCGQPNEALAELRDAFPNVKVVWMVKVGKRFKLRTDITHFATWEILRWNDEGIIEAKNVGGHKSKDVDNLRYCTDLVALDLGHNSLTDLSFLEPLKNLRWLILADNKITDITVLGTLPHLYYLELLSNRITDISPLANLTELVDLNIGGCSEKDATAVCNIKSLKRLWITDFFFKDKKAQRAEIEAALPDCEICWVKDNRYTLYGWRTHERYYEMRRALGMVIRKKK
ncbi:MAG: leucine-rich repeat domain-containing protein [Clostridia bacterium]|nr:leucine-rich repeat domain-containing protein [Clostridia bacterium]